MCAYILARTNRHKAMLYMPGVLGIFNDLTTFLREENGIFVSFFLKMYQHGNLFVLNSNQLVQIENIVIVYISGSWGHIYQLEQ